MRRLLFLINQSFQRLVQFHAVMLDLPNRKPLRLTGATIIFIVMVETKESQVFDAVIRRITVEMGNLTALYTHITT
jgi:hypothetical protein